MYGTVNSGDVHGVLMKRVQFIFRIYALGGRGFVNVDVRIDNQDPTLQNM